MKRTIVMGAIFACLLAASSGTYGQNASKEPAKTTENVPVTPNGASSEIEKFKHDSAIKTKKIDDYIGELKVYFYQNKIKNKEAFQDNLNLLEQKNDHLSLKLKEQKGDDQEKLADLKLEFNQGMDELGKALKNFIINNK